MKLIKNRCFTLDVKKAGKGEPFHVKPIICGNWQSYSKLKYANKGMIYDCTNYMLSTQTQIFWLWFYFELNLVRQTNSEFKVVKYEDTHYFEIAKSYDKQL